MLNFIHTLRLKKQVNEITTKFAKTQRSDSQGCGRYGEIETLLNVGSNINSCIFYNKLFFFNFRAVSDYRKVEKVVQSFCTPHAQFPHY